MIEVKLLLVGRYVLYLIAKVSVAEYSRGDEGPGVEDGTEPGGDDLDPHGRRVGGEIRQIIVIAGTAGG